MKEVRRYKCDYCGKIRATLRGIEKHEYQCIHSPKSVNCYRCAYAFDGERYNDFGYQMKDGPCCAYTEESIFENIASRCEHYQLSDEPYYARQTCPEAPEAEDV
jgi:hypothetical protein